MAAEAHAVGLVAVASHREPRDVTSIGRELRILVVARQVLQVLGGVDSLMQHGLGGLDGGLYIVGRLAEVGGLLFLYVVEEDIRIGGDAVSQTGLLATGIGNLLGVGAPRQLFHAAEGLHGTLEGLALENINVRIEN